LSLITGDESRCPSCRAHGLTTFFEARRLPVHQNRLMGTREAALTCPRGDIRLGFCRECGLVVNLAFDPSLVAYSTGYDNDQTHSPTFRAYLERTARMLVSSCGLAGKRIIEVGCGKGEFLTLLCRYGPNRGIGFDPACRPRGREDQEAGAAGGPVFVQDFYSEKYARLTADLFCCRHVLEHVGDPRSILGPMGRAMARRAGSLAFFEVPDFAWSVRNAAFWDVYYEHSLYFTASSLTRLMEACGFVVEEVAPAFGGQYLWLLAGLESEVGAPRRRLRFGGTGPGPGAGRDIVSDEIRNFADRYRVGGEKVRNLVLDHLRSGGKCVLWGAGAKGVTLLNALAFTPNEIEFVVDVNPAKHGHYVPGTGQEIIPPERLTSMSPSRPLLVLVTNPNYVDEIRAALRDLGLRATVACP